MFRNINFNYLKFVARHYISERKTDACMQFAMVLYLFVVCHPPFYIYSFHWCSQYHKHFYSGRGLGLRLATTWWAKTPSKLKTFKRHQLVPFLAAHIPWPNTSASHMVNNSRLSACPGKMKHSWTSDNLRNKPQQKQLGKFHC